eukprot:Nk52_evm6s328 gene=Nk52_evmTU6s328
MTEYDDSSLAGLYKDNAANVRKLKDQLNRVLVAQGKREAGELKDIKSVEDESSAFNKAFLAELKKINAFYVEREHHLYEEYENIRHLDVFSVLLNPDIPKDSLEDLPEMLVIYFSNVRVLRHFVQWNFNMLFKVASEFEANIPEDSPYSSPYFQKLIEKQQFYRSEGLAEMVKKAQELNDALERHTKKEKEKTCFPRFSFETVFTFVVCLSLLEVVILEFFKNDIQGSGTYITLFLKKTLGNPYYTKFTEMMHFKITSQSWLLLSAVIYWAVHNQLGANLYAFVSLGFSLKSLGKAFIKAPRNFWLHGEGHYSYCGRGYSLPSGHAMVSLLALSFIIVKFRKPWVLLFTIVYSGVLFVNVQYIGTHTYADVIVGWTFALLWLVLYLLIEKLVHKHYLSRGEVPSYRVQAFCFFALTVVILILDYFENNSHVEWPEEWKENMAKVCGGTPESAGKMMTLKLEYANTFLTIGVAIGYLLKVKFLNEDHYGKVLWESVVMSIFGGLVFIKMGGYIKLILHHYTGSNRLFHQTSNFLNPIWILFVAPWIFGNLISYSPHRYAQKKKAEGYEPLL